MCIAAPENVPAKVPPMMSMIGFTCVAPRGPVMSNGLESFWRDNSSGSFLMTPEPNMALEGEALYSKDSIFDMAMILLIQERCR